MTRRLAAALALALLLGGCQGLGISRDELPERRFALHWYDVETQRRRAEAIADSDPNAQSGTPGGMPNVDEFARYFGRLLGVQETGEDRETPIGMRLAERFPGRLALIDARSGAVELLPATPGALPRDWSADGRRLIFSQLVGRVRQLFIYDTVRGDVRPLSRGPAVHADGCFGPDGRYVFVTTTVTKDSAASRLELTAPGGARPAPLTEGPNDHAVACAPDGSAVAWVRTDERGRDSLMSRSPLPDGPVRRLGPGRFPSFSPDSEWIAYSALREGRWTLHRIRADGSGRRTIGTGTLHEVQPTFSPDGRLVLYVADNGFEHRIYVRRFDGSGDRLLLDSGGGAAPVW